MTKKADVENVAVHKWNEYFWIEKWQNTIIWGEIFVNLQTLNWKYTNFDEIKNICNAQLKIFNNLSVKNMKIILPYSFLYSIYFV